MDRDRFETAVRGGHTALVELAVQLKDAGLEPIEVYEQFDHFRASLRATGRTVDEDLVMDVMDRVYGWCRPETRLFPEG